jgi:predicted acetyltransferase
LRSTSNDRENAYDSIMPVVLRPFDSQDEEVGLIAHMAFAEEGLIFLLGYQSDMSWQDWLAHIERYRVGSDLPANRVRAEFLAAEVNGELVGRVSIRFALNDWLAREGGHIGYGVLPGFRRKGHATEMLRQAADLAHHEGVDPLLIICDEDNLGSATVIERCGGVFESLATTESGTTIRRYWIQVESPRHPSPALYRVTRAKSRSRGTPLDGR